MAALLLEEKRKEKLGNRVEIEVQERAALKSDEGDEGFKPGGTPTVLAASDQRAIERFVHLLAGDGIKVLMLSPSGKWKKKLLCISEEQVGTCHSFSLFSFSFLLLLFFLFSSFLLLISAIT